MRVADSQHSKKDGVDATRVPLKSWKGQDKWTMDDAFGWVCSSDVLLSHFCFNFYWSHSYYSMPFLQIINIFDVCLAMKLAGKPVTYQAMKKYFKPIILKFGAHPPPVPNIINVKNNGKLSSTLDGKDSWYG